MATNRNSVKSRARRDLVGVRDQLRRERRERDQRISSAALDVRVNLAKAADAELAAGRAIQQLYDEGLTVRDIATWTGGLTAAELKRLRRLATETPENPDVNGSPGATTGRTQLEE